MRRAEVYRSWVLDLWQVALWDGQPADRSRPIARRDPDKDGGVWLSCTDYPTHAEALTYALSEVATNRKEKAT